MLLTDEEILEELSQMKIVTYDLPDGRKWPILTIEVLQVIKKAQLKKVVEWGDEDCPHSKERYLRPVKHECNKCWQSLLNDSLKEGIWNLLVHNKKARWRNR